MSEKRFDSTRLERVLQLYRLLKTVPEMGPGKIRSELGIGKTSYDRYRRQLHRFGVEFHFDRKAGRQVITKDGFLTAPGLSLDERLAIILAVARLGTLQESFLGSLAREAASKLLTVDDPAMCMNCSSLLRIPETPGHVGASREVVDTLFTAVTTRRRIRIIYGRPGASTCEYEVDPFQVYLREGALYLDGYHWKRKSVACFKVCRIYKVVLTSLYFSNMQGYEYGDRHRNSFCIFATDRDPETVRIWFSKFAAAYIREEYHHPSQRLVEQENGAVIYEVTVDEPREVLWWAMRWGGEFEVLGPGWLREEAAVMVRKMMKRYGASE